MKRVSQKRDDKKKAAQTKFKSINSKKDENDSLVCISNRELSIFPLIVLAGGPR